MSYRPHGRARVNPNAPQAFAVCDRCGTFYNRVDLTTQMDWAGTRLVSKNLAVCSGCLDEPAPFKRAFTLPPDPVPIRDPRAMDFAEVRDNFIVTNDGVRITDNSASPLVTSTTTGIDLLLED